MFASELKRLRTEQGLSLRRLADRAHVSFAYLCQIENGAKAGSVAIAKACDAALRTGSHLTDLASLSAGNTVDALTVLGKADVDRRTFLRSAAYSAALSAVPLAGTRLDRLASPAEGRTVGMDEANDIKAFADFFIKRDEIQGGGIGRTAVAEFLATDVAGILKTRFAAPDARSAAFSAAAEIAYLLGWKAHDADTEGMAQRYYMAALRLAEESGDTGHQAFALRILAIQGVDVGQRKYSVPLAEEALRRATGRTGADTEALFKIAVARCHAENGNRREAMNVIRQAEPNLHAQVTSEIPRWAAIWSPNKATLINQTAQTFTALGEVSEAEKYYRLAASLWDRETRPRVYALAMTNVGMAQWQLGAHGDAEASWRNAVPVLQSVESARTEKALGKIQAVAPELVAAT